MWWKAFHVTIGGNFLEIKKNKIYWPFFWVFIFEEDRGECAEWTGFFNLPLCLVKGVFVGHLDLYP